MNSTGTAYSVLPTGVSQRQTYHASMKALDRTQMAKQYAGQWVALKHDRKTVLAAGKTLRQARLAAAKKGDANPMLTRMPRTIRSFIGSHSPA